MRLEIFKKASKLHDVELEGESRDRIYLRVGDYGVTIFCDTKNTFVEKCTCTHHSIFGGLPGIEMRNLCSYTLSALHFLIHYKETR